MTNERYIVKPEDITGDISGFPIEVVQWMVDEALISVNRGPNDSPSAILRFFSKERHCSLLIWDDIDEKIGVKDFCVTIIGQKKFDLFFERYPKTSDMVEPKAEITGTPILPPNDSLEGALLWQKKEKNEQRLYETAKAAMQGMLSNYDDAVLRYTEKEIAKFAINYAKELLRQLDKETKTKTHVEK